MKNNNIIQIPIFRSILFPRNYTFVHLSLINKVDHFQGSSEIFAMFCAPCTVIDSRQKRFVMNMHLRKCFTLFRLKKPDFVWLFFGFHKKPKALKKSRISKSDFKKAKFVTLAQSSQQPHVCPQPSTILINSMTSYKDYDQTLTRTQHSINQSHSESVKFDIK